ncbi:MAG: EAL and HDOD domain-containing protein [Bacillota bacterium]
MAIKSYIARQPIFNQCKRVIGYELLYRDGMDNFYQEIDGDLATSQVLTNSFGVIGIEELTQGKLAFINFTKNLLEKEIATLFDSNVLVVEILEDVELTSEVIAKCKELRAKGYTIALDDFVFAPEYAQLLELAHIVKVDFLITSPQERRQLVDKIQDYEIELLAEKVESEAQFREAQEMGYSYFQGYFFKRPDIVSGKDLPVYPTNYLQVLRELNQPQPNLDKIARIIKQDMALSYKLLRLINSAAFGVRKEVDSIKQALILLGLDEIEKWFDLVVIKEIAQDKPTEVIRISLIRAKFAELLGEKIAREVNTSQLFMMGLFSLLDVLMDNELNSLLKELPIAPAIKQALTGQSGLFRDIYELILAYEEGEWDLVTEYKVKLGVPEGLVGILFLEAIEWTEEVMVEV